MQARQTGSEFRPWPEQILRARCAYEFCFQLSKAGRMSAASRSSWFKIETVGFWWSLLALAYSTHAAHRILPQIWNSLHIGWRIDPSIAAVAPLGFFVGYNVERLFSNQSPFIKQFLTLLFLVAPLVGAAVYLLASDAAQRWLSYSDFTGNGISAVIWWPGLALSIGSVIGFKFAEAKNLERSGRSASSDPAGWPQ